MSTVDHTSRAHALLSASGSDRWMNCTPSARLEEKFAESSSSFAEEGTLAHEFGDLYLRFFFGKITKKVYDAEVKKLRKHKLYTEEMEPEVSKYTDYVIELFGTVKKKDPSAIILIEERLDYSHLVEGGYGTGDVTILADDEIYVVDLKYGLGVKVSAVENPQLKLYGSGALRKFEMSYDIKTVTVIIVQPRLDHIDQFSISAEDLITWGEEVVRPKALLAYSGAGEQVAGDWCKWCKVKPMCRALAAKNIELAKHDFQDPHKLSDSEILAVYSQLDMLTDWAKSVKDFILDTAVKGKEWTGLKVVEGKANRKWLDEDEVRKFLYSLKYSAEQVIDVSVKSVPEIEKLVGKTKFPDLLGKHVFKPNGAPTLAPLSSNKPAMLGISTAKADFAEPPEQIDFESFNAAIYAANPKDDVPFVTIDELSAKSDFDDLMGDVDDEDDLNLFS